jgi:hypothetical protein
MNDMMRNTFMIKTTLILTITVLINSILMPFNFPKDATAGGNTTNSNITVTSNSSEPKMTNNTCNTTGQYVITLKADILDNPESKSAVTRSLLDQLNETKDIIIPKQQEKKIQQGVFVIESSNSAVIEKLIAELSKDPRIGSIEQNKCVAVSQNDIGNNRTA